jgi:hypothetical protein
LETVGANVNELTGGHDSHAGARASAEGGGVRKRELLTARPVIAATPASTEANKRPVRECFVMTMNE